MDISMHEETATHGELARLSTQVLDLETKVQRLQTTLDSIGEGIISTDALGMVQHINPVAETLTGWQKKDALGLPIDKVFRLVHEKTHTPIEHPVEKLLNQASPSGNDNLALLLTRDGSERVISTSSAPIRTPQGDITGIVLVFRDQTQERLFQRYNETRLSLIEFAVEHTISELLTRCLDVVGEYVQSPIGFYHFVEPDGKTLSLQQWSTRTLLEFCEAKAHGIHYDINQAGVWVDCVYQKKPVIHNDYASLPHKKGMPEGHAEVIRELVVPVIREGKVVAILGVGNKAVDYTSKDVEIVSYLADVTWEIVRQKRAEEALRESEERFRMLVESGPVSIFLVHEGRITFSNPEAVRMLGYDHVDDVVGLEVFDIIAPKYHNVVRYGMRRNAKGRSNPPFDIQFMNLSGEPIWCSTATVYTQVNGVPTMLVVGQDISERKEIEAAKTSLEAQFHQAQKLESIGRLAGGVAHDLNNLLLPIMGYAEIMIMNPSNTDSQYKPLQEIIKAGNRARELVHQLLAFSRKQALEFRPIQLNVLIKDFESLIRRTIREDIDIRILADPLLPQIQGDAGQLEQVIMNMAVNAQDAMPNGGTLTIETARTELDAIYAANHGGVTPGSYAMLLLRDTGCGMDAETRKHLFEPFFTTKSKESGTGLGLATVYGIVKQHNGHIWCYSEPGLGAVFKIYLPQIKSNISPKPIASQSHEILDGSETILLVEDNQQVRDLVHSLLEKIGHTVLVAKDGKQALALIEGHQGPLDLLLTDVIMPEMNGKELVERVVERCPDIKTLYMSGYTEDVIARHGVMDEGINFIEKPFNLESLAKKIRQVLD